MTRFTTDNLINELTDAGVSAVEARELATVARQLTRSPQPVRSVGAATEALETILTQPRRMGWLGWIARHAVSVSLAGVLALIGAPFALAQTSLPGDRLYPLKLDSEAAVTSVIPSLKSALPVRRSGEVKQLIDQNMHRDQVPATLRAVTQPLDQRGADRQSDRMERNLERSKQQATDSEKQAIDQTLETLHRNQSSGDDHKSLGGDHRESHPDSGNDSDRRSSSGSSDSR